MNDAADSRTLKIACPQCRQKLDLSGLPPFSRVECPACGSDVIVPVWFDNYLLEEPIGNGGMADVYRALDLALDREVAIKILKSELNDHEGVRSQFFLREARTAATINHRAVVPIYNCGVYDGRTYIIMQFMSGGSLESRLRRSNGALDIREVAEWICDVAEGLDVALAHGIVHHDVKPGNILLDGDGNAKIGDFGLAQAAGGDASGDVEPEPDPTGLRNWISPYYVSPEKVVRGAEGASGDIYSLGATFYHLLTGTPPFVGEDLQETIRMRLTEDPAPPEHLRPAIGPFLSDLVTDMLERAPENRPDYKEIIARINAALEEFDEELGIATHEFQPRKHPAYSYRRRSSAGWIAWLLLVLVLLSAAAFPLYLKDRRVIYDYAPYLAKLYGELDDIPMTRFDSVQNCFREARASEAIRLCRSIYADENAPAPERAMAAYFAGIATLLNSDSDAVESIVSLERGVKRIRDDASDADARKIRPLLYAFSKMSGTGFEAQVFYQSPADKTRCELASYLRSIYDGMRVSQNESRELSRDLSSNIGGQWLGQAFLVRKSLWDSAMGIDLHELDANERNSLEPLFRRFALPTDAGDPAASADPLTRRSQKRALDDEDADEASARSDSSSARSRSAASMPGFIFGVREDDAPDQIAPVKNSSPKRTPFGTPKDELEGTKKSSDATPTKAVVHAMFSKGALAKAAAAYRELGRPTPKSVYSISESEADEYLAGLPAAKRQSERRRIQLLEGVPEYLEQVTKVEPYNLKADATLPRKRRIRKGGTLRFADGLVYYQASPKSKEHSFDWDDLPLDLCLQILEDYAGHYTRLGSDFLDYVPTADDDEREQVLANDLTRCAVLALWFGKAEKASELARAAWKALPTKRTQRSLEAYLLN